MLNAPLRFQPVPRVLVWGGRRLETVLGRALPPGDPVGESWELVDLPEVASEVADGPWAGTDLTSLTRDHARALLGRGRPSGGRFPLLVKLLDAQRVLSVQVHPDEAAARRIGDGARPKTEAWFILHADPGATIYLGLRDGVGHDDLAAALDSGDIEPLLARIEPRAGDVVHVEAGTIHAVGAGILLVEVQQPSDTTYRVHDWGRVGLDGRPRPLHTEQALVSIRDDRPAPGVVASGRIACEAFSAWWVHGGGLEPADDIARVLVATSGGTLAHASTEQPLSPGDTVLLPAACGDVEVLEADYVRVQIPGG